MSPEIWNILTADDTDVVWMKIDGLVKLWMYGTLLKKLFQSTSRTGGTLRELWVMLRISFATIKRLM